MQLESLQGRLLTALVEAVKQSEGSEQYQIYVFGSTQYHGGHYGFSLNDELLNEIGAFSWAETRAAFTEVAARASQTLQSQEYPLIVTFDEDTGRAFFVVPIKIEGAIRQAAADLEALIAIAYNHGDHTAHTLERVVLWPEFLSAEVCREIARRAYNGAHRRAFIEYTMSSNSFSFTVYA